MEKIDTTVEIKDEDIKEEDFTSEELEADTTDWKAKALELKGIAKRRATQLAKAKEKLNAKPEIPAKPQDKIIGNKYFQQDLKELRDAKIVKAALPSDSRRSGNPARDTIEYWQAKIDGGAA